MQATNIITNAIPTIIIPELRLLTVTRRASGPINAANIPQTRHSLIFFPSLVMITAKTRITVTLTSSAGWIRSDRVPSHRFFPLTSMPRLVKFTSSIQT